MLRIDCFKAGKGDCFLISWPQNAAHRLLIDFGIQGTYRFLAPRVKDFGVKDAVIVTHVDYDHIGGFFKWLSDQEQPFNSEVKVYMNTPNLILGPPESNLVGVEHGVDLEQMLYKLGVTVIPIFLEKNSTPIEDIYGLQLQVISPNKEVLSQLIKEWTASKVYQQYLLENKQNDNKVNTNVGDLRSIEDILTNPPRPHKWKDDLLNSSSISFIIHYKGNRLLFLGDANPSLVCIEFDRLGFNKNNRLPLDLIKISHHGSLHNTTQNMLERICCMQYLISTDSSGPYYHPSRETLILIATYGRPAPGHPIIIYSNYDLPLEKLLNDDELKSLNLQFKQIEFLDFPDK
jgi:beta-lactamase superfamily II metal-dependent hydrolase